MSWPIIGFTWMGLLFRICVGLVFLRRSTGASYPSAALFSNAYFLGITPTAGFVLCALHAHRVRRHGLRFFRGAQHSPGACHHHNGQTPQRPGQLENRPDIRCPSRCSGGGIATEKNSRQSQDGSSPIYWCPPATSWMGRWKNRTSWPSMFREIETPQGKYAVTGNHEYYAGLSRSLDFTKKAGFVLLRGETRTLPHLIHIAGVDDPAGRSLGVAGTDSEIPSVVDTLQRPVYPPAEAPARRRQNQRRSFRSAAFRDTPTTDRFSPSAC